MQLKVIYEPPYSIIEIYGEVDASSSIQLDEQMKAMMQEEIEALLVDGTNIQYISSAGLGVFMSYIQEMKDRNIFFAIFGLDEKTLNVFEILGLHKVMPLPPTKESAKKLKEG
ncbi:STAS domain-containing protein [Eisenibacter elegans]|jgi:anti-sigma B factor antagonist|uniref:STAS domain-containing protein n=1 Tax=Eisenibacter elegans TaxID=997 RepID=UPI000404E49B|nr:STAS domain-containing protein [Eisenibacter elegans]